MADDADRLNVLSGGVRQAAKAKMGRAQQLEDAEDEALGKPKLKTATPLVEGSPQKAGLMSKMLRMFGK